MLSIVIPAYKGAKIIPKSVDNIYRYLRKNKIEGEIIVVDDKSPDRTVAVVEEKIKFCPILRLFCLKKNSMKGWAVRKGVLEARGRYILTCDQDLSTPISEAKKLLRKIKMGADLAIGIRIHQGGFDMRRTQPFSRRLIGKIFKLMKGSLLEEIVDTQCGFKLFTRKAARYLFKRQRIKDIIYDVEILSLAKKKNYKIIQVPVIWKHDDRSAMLGASLKNVRKILLSMAKVWLWYH